MSNMYFEVRCRAYKLHHDYYYLGPIHVVSTTQPCSIPVYDFMILQSSVITGCVWSAVDQHKQLQDPQASLQGQPECLTVCYEYKIHVWFQQFKSCPQRRKLLVILRGRVSKFKHRLHCVVSLQSFLWCPNYVYENASGMASGVNLQHAERLSLDLVTQSFNNLA